MYLDKWKGTWVVQESTPLLRPQPPRLRIDLLFRKCCEAETTCGTFLQLRLIEVLTSLKFRSLASYLAEVNTARPRFKTQRMVCAVSHTIIELHSGNEPHCTLFTSSSALSSSSGLGVSSVESLRKHAFAAESRCMVKFYMKKYRRCYYENDDLHLRVSWCSLVQGLDFVLGC